MELVEAKEILGREFSFIADFLNEVILSLEIKEDSQILDIGTGSGRMAITLALNGYKVITGEPEDDFSEYAKSDWLESANKVNVEKLITFKAFRAEKLPFESNSFDMIFLFGALHHIYGRELALQECFRVSKPEGIICIIEPTPKMIKIIQKTTATHPDAEDPRSYIRDLPLSVEIKKNYFFHAYIFRK
jgi:ubiquinone/menaquinone biosynthesis C-methylase UbiE